MHSVIFREQKILNLTIFLIFSKKKWFCFFSINHSRDYNIVGILYIIFFLFSFPERFLYEIFSSVLGCSRIFIEAIKYNGIFLTKSFFVVSCFYTNFWKEGIGFLKCCMISEPENLVSLHVAVSKCRHIMHKLKCSQEL